MPDLAEFSFAPFPAHFMERLIQENGGIEQLHEAFRTQRYVVLRNFLAEPLPTVCTRYAILNEQIGTTRIDQQVPDSKYLYGDPLMDSILDLARPLMESVSQLKLHPTYAYCRIYRKGDELVPHMDRPSCEISASVTLGYNANYVWPLYMEGKAISGEPGDMLIYRGCELQHWREPFEGSYQAQLFMHYVDQNGPYAQDKFDRRPFLGLPACTRGAANLEEAHQKIEKENKIDLVMRQLWRKRRT